MFSLLKYIWRDWENFLCFIKFEVGDGIRIKFWYDKCCDDLKGRLSQNCFHLKCNMKAFVVDHMRFPNDTIHWALNLIRAVQD